MATAAKVMIDKAKLKMAFQMRGISWNDAAEKIGYARNYFSTVLSDKNKEPGISRVAVQGLEAFYGIMREEYEVPRKKELPVEEAIQPIFGETFEDPEMVTPGRGIVVHVEIDYDRLNNTIYNAIMGAFNKAGICRKRT